MWVNIAAKRYKKVEAWLKKAMVDGMDEVLNGSEEGPHVPVEVESDRV